MPFRSSRYVYVSWNSVSGSLYRSPPAERVRKDVRYFELVKSRGSTPPWIYVSSFNSYQVVAMIVDTS